ncbi:MAG: beta-N-acetylhexosaminidase [Pseudomonadota bacterium]|nr:beta-N-acetylhexosaminidase [Pseudomonadota bacterium]
MAPASQPGSDGFEGEVCVRTRAIYGCAGEVLSAEERAFFADAQPWGFILFARNVADPDQARALVESLRQMVNDPMAPVLIDQEGGRVARLKPPHWKARPAAARFGALYVDNPEAAREATYLNARLMAAELSALGVNVDCTPVLDVPVAGADAVIGDRAFSHEPAVVIDLGRAVIQGMVDGGVLPVMKHIPGHGRAMADSHLALPRVATAADSLSASDFVTFRSLNHCPLAMTAHVVYEAIDPQRPATTSPKLIRDVIRGEIGFDGLLLSDDLSMQALSGRLSARAKAALFAGCDIVLHCNGKMDEMREVAAEVTVLEDAALKRAEAARAHLAEPEAFDCERAEQRLADLLGALA